MSRIYPLNKIKYWYCYDVDDVCRLYKNYRLYNKTVLGWKKKGLKTIDSRNPALFYGLELSQFLGKLNQSNKCKTSFDQIFCMKCQEGKSPLKKQIQLIPNNNKFLRVKAICQTCKSEMYKSYKLVDLQNLKRTFNAVHVLELDDSRNPTVETPFFDQAKDNKKEPTEESIQLDLFS